MYRFIINPNSKSSSAGNLWSLLEARLEQRQADYRVYFTDHAGHGREIAADLCEEHRMMGESEPLTIIIVGGDGSVNEIINGISSYQNVILGFIPCGSGNDLAANLGLPSDPLAALDRILSPKRIEYIDHGILSCCDTGDARKFSVSAGIGYDADICFEALNSPVKKFLNRIRLGKATYFVIALKQIFTHKPLYAKLVIDGVTQQCGKYLCVVAMNGAREGGGLRLAPKARMNDRKISVCIVKDFPKLFTLLMMPLLLLGLHTHIKGIDVIECSSLEIISKKPATTHTDGEFAGKHTHIRFTCTKEQVKVIL